MKKIFIVVMAVFAVYNAYAIRFDPGYYEFVSSDKNTRDAERPMSPYMKGSVVFFRNDTAYMFHPTKDMNVGELTVCPELMGLGIDGTFAYDESRRKLYFSKKSESGNELYEASYVSGEWTNVTKLKIEGVMPVVKYEKNSALPVARYVYMESATTGFYNPTLSKGGKRIYFSGTFKAGKGDRDLWYIDREKADLWGFPQSVGDSINGINTSSREDYAFIVGDTALVFASNRGGGKGGMDLYVSYKTGDNSWGKPENISEMNSNSDDYNLIYVKNTPFFISKRAGGKGSSDIYRAIEIKPDREPELFSDMMLVEPKDFHWILFYFGFNKSDLSAEDIVQMDELAEAMKEFPGAKFLIEGHTDTRGSDAYNMKLSQQRADFVKAKLIERGIPGANMQTAGRGMRQPVVPDAEDEAEHELNRRVEIKIINNH